MIHHLYLHSSGTHNFYSKPALSFRDVFVIALHTVI